MTYSRDGESWLPPLLVATIIVIAAVGWAAQQWRVARERPHRHEPPVLRPLK